MSKPLILGLDISIANTGYCIGVDDIPFKTGLVQTKAKQYSEQKVLDDVHRVEFIFNELKQLISSRVNGKPIDVIVLEGYAMSARNTSSLTTLCEIGGLVKNYLKSREIPFIIAPPTVVKKFATSKGNCKKDVVMKEVYKRWNFDTDNDNIADAYVLMQIGRAHFHKLPAPKFQEDCLKKCVIIEGV